MNCRVEAGRGTAVGCAVTLDQAVLDPVSKRPAGPSAAVARWAITEAGSVVKATAKIERPGTSALACCIRNLHMGVKQKAKIGEPDQQQHEKRKHEREL